MTIQCSEESITNFGIQIKCQNQVVIKALKKVNSEAVCHLSVKANWLCRAVPGIGSKL